MFTATAQDSADSGDPSLYSSIDKDDQQVLEAFRHQPAFQILAQLSPKDRHDFLEQSSLSHHEKCDEKPSSMDKLDDNYFDQSLTERVGNRVIWLFVLMIANLGTTIAIQAQEDVLEKMVILAAFLPLLIGSGGHITTQSATVVIQDLSQGGITIYQTFRKVVSEAFAGVWIGLALGIVLVGIALLMKSSLSVALVAGVSLLLITILSTISGTLLPFIFEAMGTDPALISAPLSATLVDVAGVFIYLGIARLII
jgi:magnesium transporter